MSYLFGCPDYGTTKAADRRRDQPQHCDACGFDSGQRGAAFFFISEVEA